MIAAVPFSSERVFITIAAGIKVESVSKELNTKNVVRVLPNLPMFIQKGVSAICYNDNVCAEDFDFIVNVFEAAGSVLKIDECDINKIIGVTSSSPAYVFKFIKAICDGAKLQGLEDDGILEAVCDVIIGSAELIKSGFGTPDNLAKAVASKGGTTERALAVLDDNDFEKIIADAMIACTKRADELGK
jgi:pyrroline-5-carboxylate reductase